MCNGKHLDETDDEMEGSIHSSSAVSDDDVQPAEATATSRSVTFAELGSSVAVDKQHGDVSTQNQDDAKEGCVSTKAYGWDVGILLPISVFVVIVAYGYNRWKAAAAEE